MPLLAIHVVLRPAVRMPLIRLRSVDRVFRLVGMEELAEGGEVGRVVHGRALLLRGEGGSLGVRVLGCVAEEHIMAA